MFYGLLALGVLLIGFGGLVLLRFSDRPGATLKFMGGEMTSNGAGLPLIALGVGCIIFAAVRFPPRPGQAATDTSNSVETVAANGAAPSTPPVVSPPSTTPAQLADAGCFTGTLNGIAADRVRSLEVGMRDQELIGSHQPLDQPFAVVLTDQGQRIGLLRLRLFRGSNYSNDLYRIEEVLDAACAPVSDLRNVSRGGNPRELINWDSLRMKVGAGEYELRLGGEGSIGASFTRVL
jgi:hypothetical protein